MNNVYSERGVEYLKRNMRFYKITTSILVVFCLALLFAITYTEIFNTDEPVETSQTQTDQMVIDYDSFLAELESMDFISGYTIRKSRDEWDLAVSFDNNGPSLFYYDLTTEEEIFGTLREIRQYQTDIRN